MMMMMTPTPTMMVLLLQAFVILCRRTTHQQRHRSQRHLALSLLVRRRLNPHCPRATTTATSTSGLLATVRSLATSSSAHGKIRAHLTTGCRTSHHCSALMPFSIFFPRTSPTQKAEITTLTFRMGASTEAMTASSSTLPGIPAWCRPRTRATLCVCAV